MANYYNAQIGVVDASGTVNVIYPITKSSNVDVTSKVYGSGNATTVLQTALDNIVSAFSNYLPLNGGTMTGTIIMPANDNKGIEPATSNYGYVGSSSKKFYKMYASTFYGSLDGSATKLGGNPSSWYQQKINWVNMKMNLRSAKTLDSNGIAVGEIVKTSFSESAYRPICYQQFESENWGFHFYPVLFSWSGGLGGVIYLMRGPGAWTEDATSGSYRASTTLSLPLYFYGSPGVTIPSTAYLNVMLGYYSA